MGWAALISLLLQILPIILKFLNSADAATFTEKQSLKLGQARAKCEEFVAACQAKGVASVAASLASTEGDW